ncbi:Scp1 protein [Saccharomycopsis crataegensis]|uniref:Scp1 protein n=1 Tax=Saccharomycopsis crataegensis TaxID=43959 RepID=A0AAV5QL54_9ASCO|nr:Scp1 protein [Saccharomycopsis crataegensis]
MPVKRASKYDAEQVQEIKDWIFHVLGQDAPQGDLLDILKDGSVLCDLSNKIMPESPVAYKKNQKMPFFQMETIEKFLKKAQKIGVPANEMFSTIDLYEKKDPTQVYTGLISLSRYSNKLNDDIPTIGPKLVEKKVSNSPHKAKTNDYVYTSAEYSYIQAHKQGRGHRVASGGSDIIRGAV